MTGSKPMTMEEQANKYVLQKERMKETNRLWRLSHKDDMKEKMKTYYQLNKERLNKRSVELVKLKKFLLKEQESLPLGGDSIF
jgi:hypothetical protein